MREMEGKEKKNDRDTRAPPTGIEDSGSKREREPNVVFCIRSTRLSDEGLSVNERVFVCVVFFECMRC